jgi:hypothetical protein
MLAHPVLKIWIIQEPNKVALWNKQHFEERNLVDYAPCLTPLILKLGARRWWVVSTTLRLLYPRKDPVPISQEAGWAQVLSGRVVKCCFHRLSIRTVQPVASRYTDRILCQNRKHLSELLSLWNVLHQDWFIFWYWLCECQCNVQTCHCY